MAAATLQGGMNYAIVLFLTFTASLVATGEYRAYFSWYSLIGLASMLESNKLYIRSLVADDRAAITALLANRLLFSNAVALIVTLAWGVGRWSGWFAMPDLLPPIAWIAALVFPFDLYIAEYQAHRQFLRLFLVELVKYGVALALFIGLVHSGQSVATAVLVQLGWLALFHLAAFAVISGRHVEWGVLARRLWPLIKAPAARDARTYSFANMFPASLEHVDKLLVGWVFGLEFLGVYTLAYSTGRFLYNILKPAMYVYYRRFVDAMPGWPLLRRVSIGFSALGLAMALTFLAAIALLPQMVSFASGRWATVILFLGYGPGILHAVYAQAFALNKDSVAAHAFRAHLLATLASLMLLGGALLSPPATALILLALQYPLRDGLSVWLMDRYRRRAA